MATDVTAFRVQGPDGPGNPLQVQAVAGAQVDVNVAKINGNTTATSGTGIQKVGITDTSGNSINRVATGDFGAGMLVQPLGNDFQSVSGSANTDLVITLAGGVSTRNHLTHLSFFYNGTNAATSVGVVDNGTQVLTIPIPANQQTALFVPLPGGGIRSTLTNTNMVITVPAGGVGITATINIGNQKF